MTTIKQAEEILALSQGGKILAGILQQLVNLLKPGTSTLEIENLANKLIAQAGGRPAFLNYPLANNLSFPSAVCASFNNEVVHGSTLPPRIIKSGDIVDLDIGMEWPVDPELRSKLNLPVNHYSAGGGFYTDTCVTVAIGKVSQEAKNLIKVTQQCLDQAIKIIKPGTTLYEIGASIEKIARLAGYGVVKDFVGHGVGYLAHEEPDIYNYAINPNSSVNISLEAGMVIAIEPMINLGTDRVKMASNGYTVLTADNSLSAHFEHTIAVTESGFKVLTQA